MTIAKGQPWGHPAPLPEDGVIVSTDAEARQVIERARRAGVAPPTLGLIGGDMCRTLGGRGEVGHLRSTDAVTFPIDIACVAIDDELHWFVAHLVARNRLWTRTSAVMNAPWLGSWNVAPKGHLNDGVVDVIDARLRPGELWAVRRRLPQGAYLPHPRIGVRRVREVEVALERGMRVWLDGTRIEVGNHDVLRVTVEADAARVVV
jgi:hypothetical protein